MDIAAIDGVSCTMATIDGPCGRLVRALATLPPGKRPTELIYCFDADGPGPAFAAADHCDHIHAGYDDQGPGHGHEQSDRRADMLAVDADPLAERDGRVLVVRVRHTRRTTSWIAAWWRSSTS